MTENYYEFCKDVVDVAVRHNKEYAAVLNDILAEKSTRERITNPQDFLQSIVWTKSEIYNFSMEIAHDTWTEYNCGHADDKEVDAALRNIAEEELRYQTENARHGYAIIQDEIEYDVMEDVKTLAEERPELFK